MANSRNPRSDSATMPMKAMMNFALCFLAAVVVVACGNPGYGYSYGYIFPSVDGSVLFRTGIYKAPAYKAPAYSPPAYSSPAYSVYSPPSYSPPAYKALAYMALAPSH
ncbi:repetitive proline-rich cell wall protein-like isoform X2 [Daphnia pulicaria]|uniref:repetitive proline-rich cell wall protein-like isoform X2 n=1 Tax=Daphnia pulicaria TaxID=35523 RepID=UPI001EEB0CAF|nr:repetitive proline-rich cell wall protein-like isoform X2 [Daphnia pulicaria]